MPCIEEIVAGPQDKPSYDFKFYADGFSKEYLEERKRLCEFPDGNLRILHYKGKIYTYHVITSNGKKHCRRIDSACSESDRHLLELLKNKRRFKQSLAIYRANYILSKKLCSVQIPAYVRERDLNWNTVSQWQGGGYYIGMIEEEYERAKSSFRLYKEKLSELPQGELVKTESKTIYTEDALPIDKFAFEGRRYTINSLENTELLYKQIQRRERLLSWCRGILKSLYVFEKGLAMQN